MKKILLGLVILVFAFIALLFALPYIVDVNQYKGKITQTLSEKTGLTIDIKGDVRLTTIPDFGLKINDIHVSGQPKAQNLEYVTFTADSFLLQLEILPLLRKSFQFKSIILNKPDVMLSLANGKKTEMTDPNVSERPSDNNSAEEAPNKIDQKEEIAAKKEDMAVEIALDALHITDGSVKVTGGAFKDPLSVNELNVKAALSSQAASLDVTADVFLKGKKLPVALTTQMTREPNWYKFDKIDYRINDIRGNGVIEIDVSGNKPDVEAVLSSSTIDLNQFMDKQASRLPSWLSLASNAYAAEDNAMEASYQSPWTEDPIDFSALSALDANIKLTVEKLRFKQVEISDIHGNINLRDKLLKADIDANVAGGKVSHAIRVDAARQTPLIKDKIKVDGVQLQSLASVSPIFKTFSGTLTLALDAQSYGSSTRQLVNQLSGNGDFTVNGGRIKGIDLEAITQSIKNGMKGDLSAIGGVIASGADQGTDFDAMSGTIKIDRGIVMNQDLVISTKRIKVNGEGQVNLPAMTINYTLTPEVDLTGLSSKNVNTGTGIVVSGPLTSPTIGINAKKAIENFITNPDNIKNLINKFR